MRLRKKKERGCIIVDILIIANTFLHKAFSEKIPITPMKLQKLLYLFYREYLRKYSQSLFPERFEAWQHGPVLSQVYARFKEYRANPIDKYSLNENGRALIYDLSPDNAFSRAFNDVWCRYKDFGAVRLSKMTHQTGSAWEAAIKSGNIFLTDEDIKNERWE
jgi:uncharacterized phage-associated protein